MSDRTKMILAAVLTVFFVVDTGWQVYHLTQGQETTFVGFALLVLIVPLLKDIAAKRSKSTNDAGTNVTASH